MTLLSFLQIIVFFAASHPSGPGVIVVEDMGGA